MPAHWLLKTEPSDYSFQDLTRDQETLWAGVKNPTALNNLKAMKKGDQLLIYHTGKEKAVVGLARVTAAADGVVRIKAVKPLKRPVALAQIKAAPALHSWDLVRIGRLSVVATTPAQFDALLALASAAPPA